MEQLLVSHWHKNTRYEMQNINGTEYIVPCEYGSVYDPIKSENEMMKIRNLGKKSLKEVIDKVKDMGLSFRNED